MVSHQCGNCGKIFTKASTYKFHINRKTPCAINSAIEYTENPMKPNETEEEVEAESDNNLDSLDYDNYYQSVKDIEDKQNQFEDLEKRNKELQKIANKPVKVVPFKESKPVKAEEPKTDLFGKDRLVLLAKANSYMDIFPDKLKTFKYNKKGSVEYLNLVLEEMDCIVSMGNVDTFITDSILQTIKGIEGFSSRTKFNISGLSDLLKSQKKFKDLVMQLSLKYGNFMAVPAEYQLLIMVMTSAFICVQKNKNTSKIEEMLSQTYVESPVETVIPTEPDMNISFNPITNKANVLSNNKNKKLVLSENPF